jgi:hypothetical protein
MAAFHVEGGAKHLAAMRGERGGGFRHLVGVARTERHVGAFGGEQLHRGTADAAAATGEDHLLPLQSQVHGLFPCLRRGRVAHGGLRQPLPF